MPRRLRTDSETGIHHVMNRGVNHQTIFFSDRDREDFEERLSTMRDRHGVTILAYALMGNHFHLLLHAPPGELSAAMHLVTTGFARHTNDRLGRDGPLFRGRFHSLAVETEAYLFTASRYVHLNPLDLGAQPALYRWSSYGVYLGRRTCPAFLDLSLLLDMFGGDARQMAEFTEGQSNVFASHPVTPIDVRLLIDAAVGMQDMRRPVSDDAGRYIQRSLALLLLDQPLSAEAMAAVHTVIGPLSDAALRMARHRARQRLNVQAELGAALNQVAAALPLRAQAA